MSARTSELICFGCGARIGAGDPLSFRCPRARGGGDVDHVLRCRLLSGHEDWRRAARAAFENSEENPFLRYHALLHSVHRARAAGLGDGDIVEIVERLDAAIAEVDGHGFVVTPFAPAPELATEIGLDPDLLLLKDETGNVSGSHKARHLMGVMLSLEASRRASGASPADPKPRLAISSCGNAALAAAVVAKAAGYPLDVYVPPDANATVVDRLQGLGAHLAPCPRLPNEQGDPCYLRFREAVGRGALPFTCQGPENGLVIEGGQTLAWEMVSWLMARGRELDRLFVQVGGGALASGCIHGLRLAHELGALSRLPKIHSVQTAGCAPLHRAWRRLAEELVGGLGGSGEDGARDTDDADLARRVIDTVSPSDLEAALHRAAQQRSRYMWPWESEPRSIATGILDDETYDWLAVVEGMLRTGGFPIVVAEDTVAEANQIARRHTDIQADPTGTAGLAGLVSLIGAERRNLSGETSVVLMTGVVRSG